MQRPAAGRDLPNLMICTLQPTSRPDEGRSRETVVHNQLAAADRCRIGLARPRFDGTTWNHMGPLTHWPISLCDASPVSTVQCQQYKRWLLPTWPLAHLLILATLIVPAAPVHGQSAFSDTAAGSLLANLCTRNLKIPPAPKDTTRFAFGSQASSVLQARLS